MHVGFKVQAKWGIGGLKREWKRFMKKFDSTKPHYTHHFKLQLSSIIS
jgi:hypothetical protein